ncbi:MAG: ATP synthase F1 subunit epsilon [Phycisphaeraceae bacterium]|nr:ATP synthase F1 subunit epsilon [Phycisphaeraceae bacterium]
MSTFRCMVVTPSESVFDAEVTYASIPSWDGQLGVMQGRSPLLARLGIGLLRLDLPGGGSQWMAVDGGFAQIDAGGLTILTERALPPDRVDRATANQALEAANARALEGGIDRSEAEAGQARARSHLQLLQHA